MRLTPYALLIVMAIGNPSFAADEEIQFYPTYGYWDDASHAWNVLVHGVVYEPETASISRALTVGAVRRMVGVDADTPEATMLEDRLRLFLVDHERGKEIRVLLGSQTHPVGESEANGHFSGQFSLSAAEADQLVRGQPVVDGWIGFRTPVSEGGTQPASGRVQLVGPSGISVISDIDDTIKVTQVADRKAMLANTFTRVFRPVAGMAKVYQRLAAQGAAFHYVSGSPWQLYDPLSDFLRVRGFPAGSMHLKMFRMTDSTAIDLMMSQEANKLEAIEPILAAFPKRRFVLVGDSGEEDPEIYGKIARKHPGQIAAILIRNVTDEAADGERFRNAMEGIDHAQWELFRDADQLQEAIDRVATPPKTAQKDKP